MAEGRERGNRRRGWEICMLWDWGLGKRDREKRQEGVRHKEGTEWERGKTWELEDTRGV